MKLLDIEQILSHVSHVIMVVLLHNISRLIVNCIVIYVVILKCTRFAVGYCDLGFGIWMNVVNDDGCN